MLFSQDDLTMAMCHAIVELARGEPGQGLAEIAQYVAEREAREEHRRRQPERQAAMEAEERRLARAAFEAQEKADDERYGPRDRNGMRRPRRR
jgi:ATPase subunit of ABC transporter with duplicated ATPase domains